MSAVHNQNCSRVAGAKRRLILLHLEYTHRGPRYVVSSTNSPMASGGEVVMTHVNSTNFVFPAVPASAGSAPMLLDLQCLFSL